MATPRRAGYGHAGAARAGRPNSAYKLETRRLNHHNGIVYHVPLLGGHIALDVMIVRRVSTP